MARQVMDAVATIGGRPCGQVFEERARYPIVVRLPEASRPQWRIGRTLAGYSCGGSREFQSRSLFIPADANARRKPRTPNRARVYTNQQPLYGGTPPTHALTAELMRYPRSTWEDLACAILQSP